MGPASDGRRQKETSRDVRKCSEVTCAPAGARENSRMRDSLGLSAAQLTFNLANAPCQKPAMPQVPKSGVTASRQAIAIGNSRKIGCRYRLQMVPPASPTVEVHGLDHSSFVSARKSAFPPPPPPGNNAGMSRRANETIAAVNGIIAALCGMRLFRNPVLSLQTTLLAIRGLLAVTPVVFFLNRSVSGK